MADDDGGGGGLRERKRLAAMLRIQAVALDMFESRGFDEVTVEEIADASDVSPSSVYRYFGTKEQILLWDEYDVVMDDWLLHAVEADVPLDGLRAVILRALDAVTPEDLVTVQRRVALVMTTPSLEQAATAVTYQMAELVGRLLAQRLGRPEVDLEVQVFSHAFTGGLLGMFHHWYGTGFAAPLRDVVEQLFRIFEEGLDVVTASSAAGAAPAPPGPPPAPCPGARPRRRVREEQLLTALRRRQFEHISQDRSAKATCRVDPELN